MNNKKLHLVYWITIGLTMSFIVGFTGSFFPVQSLAQTLLFKIGALFAISAFACLASKATSEGDDIPAAGFTVLAIAQGLFLGEIDKPGHWNFDSAIAGALFMIPSFLMIYYYSKFPRWLRIAGVIISIPFIILIILHYTDSLSRSSAVERIIFIFYQIITLCWAWQVWKGRSGMITLT